MPKSQYISPEKAFEKGYLTFDKIPLCQYSKTLAQEEEALHQRRFSPHLPRYAHYP